MPALALVNCSATTRLCSLNAARSTKFNRRSRYTTVVVVLCCPYCCTTRYLIPGTTLCTVVPSVHLGVCLMCMYVLRVRVYGGCSFIEWIRRALFLIVSTLPTYIAYTLRCTMVAVGHCCSAVPTLLCLLATVCSNTAAVASVFVFSCGVYLYVCLGASWYKYAYDMQKALLLLLYSSILGSSSCLLALLVLTVPHALLLFLPTLPSRLYVCLWLRHGVRMVYLVKQRVYCCTVNTPN